MSTDTLPITLPPKLTKKFINGDEIRVFSDSALQSQIDKVLATLPDDAKGAVVTHADFSGASVSVVGKVGDHWTVVAAGYRKWTGEMNAAADIRYAW